MITRTPAGLALAATRSTDVSYRRMSAPLCMRSNAFEPRRRHVRENRFIAVSSTSGSKTFSVPGGLWPAGRQQQEEGPSVSSQNRTGSRRIKITSITGLALASALVLTGCSPEVEKGWLPTERGTTNHTDRIMDLWVNSWIAALAVGIITWGLLVWCIIAYRRRKGTTGFPSSSATTCRLRSSI